MKRSLELLPGREDEGFPTLQSAIDFCKKRPGISRAWIGQRENFHVFIAAIEHHSRFYHIVADYCLVPQFTLRTDDQK